MFVLGRLNTIEIRGLSVFYSVFNAQIYCFYMSSNEVGLERAGFLKH